MFLKRIHTSKRQDKDLIKWRGHEVTRIEAFSDAVFAFAITLLIVSLEVPKNFDELMQSMKGFFPFAISFIMFFQIWVTQNLFFRRYGMHDETTLALNAMLMFTVLFFVYPMKFLWNSIFLAQTAVLHDHKDSIHLFYIYSGGFTAIYFLFALMYWHAYRRRAHLNLTASEAFETQTYALRNLSMSSIGLLSLMFAAMGNTALAGMAYMLVGLAVGITHAKRGKMHRKKFGIPTDVSALVTVHEPEGEKVEQD